MAERLKGTVGMRKPPSAERVEKAVMPALGQKRTLLTAAFYDWFAPDSGRAASPLK